MSVVQLLDEDPDLGARMSAPARLEASRLLRAEVFRIPRGEWDPPRIDDATTGLLVISGLMVRRLYLGPSVSGELVGPGDIIRPQEDELLPGFSPGVPEWRVLEEVTVALLDERITRAMGHWPEFSTMISARFIRRARSLAYLMAAHCFTKVQDRLLITLWHLAGRWGKVTPTGIRLPFRLTHEMLAEIIGARRPSVTVAMLALERQGSIARDENRCYLVCGDPPDWTTTRPAIRERET